MVLSCSIITKVSFTGTSWTCNTMVRNLPSPGGVYFQKNWVWVCGTRPEPLPYFRQKSVIFSALFRTWSKIWYPISDLALKSIPYFRPALYQCKRQCLYAFIKKDTKLYKVSSLKGNAVVPPNDEDVASSKKHAQFKTTVHKLYPISDQNG